MASKTIPGVLFDAAERRGNQPAHFTKVGGSWQAMSWRDYAETVKRAGKSLMAMGIQPGDTVSILGFNRSEWVIMNMAVMAIGGAGAGIYTTCSADEVQYIVDHCESKVALVENTHQFEKIQQLREQMPRLEHVVGMKGRQVGEGALTWDEFLDRGSDVSDEQFFARLHALEPGGLATLIYTSGTTGPPKAVMLTHDNLHWTAETLNSLVHPRPDDCVLSYLPLSHIAEQQLTIHGPVMSGASVYFAESIEKVPDNLKEVQPHLFFGVPRIWEKFQAGIADKLEAATGIKKKLITWVQSVARRKVALQIQGKNMPLPLRAQYALADRLVLSKLKPAIGLGRARMCVSGAAPISKEILEFFASLDIVVCEVYGQSEDTGPTTLNLPDRARLGTVGGMIPGIEVKIADDGEILVRGRNVFKGYLKDRAATDETLIDGWLHSGDLGAIEDGFLSITGRKKDIIITAGGKNIAPKNLEAALKNNRLISEAVVIGDRRKYLTALITLDEEAARAFIREHGGQNGVPMHQDELLKNEVQAAIDQLNRQLAQVETIKKFTILPRNLTIEDGELTPTLKVKRNVVNQNFAEQIEAMY